MKMIYAASRAVIIVLAFGCLGRISAWADPAVFEVTVTSANVIGNDLILDNPALNGKPTSNLIVTQNYTQTSEYNKTYTNGGPETFLNHPVGAGYDTGLKRWYIYIEDNLPMPEGATFNVLVGGGAPVYATPLNSESSETFLSQGKGAPSALLFITHFFNPNRTLPGGNGILVMHDKGLGYDSTTSDGASAFKHWYIGTEDASPAEAAAYFVFNGSGYANKRHVNAFSVTSLPGSNEVSVFTSNLGGIPIIPVSTNVGGIGLNNPLINGNPNAVIFIAHVLSNGNTYNNTVGVFYDGSNWNIMNANVNQSTGFSVETFNVLAFDAPNP